LNPTIIREAPPFRPALVRNPLLGTLQAQILI
jgi:hypothetical protein